MTESQKIVFETLFKEFHTMLLTKEQMSKITNIWHPSQPTKSSGQFKSIKIRQ